MPYRYNAITGELDVVVDASSGGAITQIDTDSGTVTPVAGVVNLNGQNGISTSGSSNNGVISSPGFISEYVVSQDGDTDYSTIQDALDAANGDGGGIVFVRPGTYTEDLTLYDNTQIVGGVGLGDLGALVIVGEHTPPSSGSFVLRNCKLQSATNIFNSAAAGTSSIFIIDVAVDVTNGYVFNLPNWTSSGGFGAFDIGEIGSTDCGWVNNTGGATVFMTNITMGAGSGNTMITSGFVELYNCVVQCPVDFQTGTNGIAAGGTVFENTVTFSNNSSLDIYNSSFVTGANTALNYNSSANSKISSVSIDTSANPAINGSGVGQLTLTNVSFLDNGTIGGSLNLGTSRTYPTQMGNGELLIGSLGQPAVTSTLTGDENIRISNAAGSITIDLTQNAEDTAIHGWNGTIIETPLVAVTSDGATITLSVERSGGGDLTVIFSDGYYAWDTTPADTVTLTAGTDTVPQVNYVYFLQSTKTLTASTAGWPAAEHAPIATVICQSAATLQTDGPYKQQNWTDHIIDTNEQGHISHLNFWIRQQSATYLNGVAQNYTITSNVGTPDNVFISTAIGTVLQLHENTFPVFANADDYYVINDSTTPYTIVNDLNALLTDSTGASMAGRYFSLVLWGSVNSNGESKRFINLPSGSYANQADLELDPDAYANFTIPDQFKSTGFLISEWKLRHQAVSGGTWTSIEEVDLRGLLPNTIAGGGGGSLQTFDDAAFRIFDNGDTSKLIAFEASAITTSTTRTITMADYDIDLADVLISASTDSGSATPASGTLTFTGGTGVSTSGTGSTVTIDVAGGGITWNETTVTGPTSIVAANGYIANNAATVGFTLPATASVGDYFRITGKGAGGWSLGQNAGQTIHFGSSDTTTGAGGSLASTDAQDTIELVCITANTDFNVLSSIGNITVV